MGTYQETSSLATHWGTLGHSHLSLLSHFRLFLAGEKKKSGISVRELISTLKKKKKAQAGNELPFPKNFASEEKATTISVCHQTIVCPTSQSPFEMTNITQHIPVLCCLPTPSLFWRGFGPALGFENSDV